MTIAAHIPLVPAEPAAVQWQEVNRKLDRLTQQVQWLAAQAEVERQRRQAFVDLQADLAPILRELYAVAEEELGALQPHVELADLLYFLRRLARNVRTFNELLDQLESLRAFAADAAPLTKEMMAAAICQLDELEQKGYFGFLRQSVYLVDQIVTAFREEEVRLLGDHIVLLLNTVKALTQPEILHLAHHLTAAFEEVETQAGALPPSLLGLLGQLRDPEVRRGLAVTLALLKALAKPQPVSRRHASGNGRGTI